MKCLLLLLTLSLSPFAYSQSPGAPVEVTPELKQTIKAKIEDEIAQLRKLQKPDQGAVHEEFEIDTTRIEKYMREYMKYDYSTAGMRTAVNDAAMRYDQLLNKYYKKLLATLKPSDKSALIEAEKVWIVFKDKDLKLRAVLAKDEYSGGGTIQQLFLSNARYDIIKQRAITLYEFYSSMERHK